jgi:ArsR family transcriptional regulator
LELDAVTRSDVLTIFKALADGTRFDVYRLIAAQEAPICACDIVARFDVSQPTIAHHLKVLRDARLITSTRQGIWAYYQVHPSCVDVLRMVADDLTATRRELATV